MLTFPEIVTLPDVLVNAPPDIVRAAADSVNVAFAKVPPEMVNVAPTAMLDAAVAVPAVTVRLLKNWVMLMDPLAAKETVELPAVKVALAAVAVQLPFTVIVEDPATTVP